MLPMVAAALKRAREARAELRLLLVSVPMVFDRALLGVDWAESRVRISSRVGQPVPSGRSPRPPLKRRRPTCVGTRQGPPRQLREGAWADRWGSAHPDDQEVLVKTA